jgi:hypothetical protein
MTYFKYMQSKSARDYLMELGLIQSAIECTLLGASNERAYSEGIIMLTINENHVQVFETIKQRFLATTELASSPLFWILESEIA